MDSSYRFTRSVFPKHHVFKLWLPHCRSDVESELVIIACTGDLSTLWWMYLTFDLTDDNIADVFRWACVNNRAKMAKWLVFEFEISKEEVLSNISWLRFTAMNGHVSLIKWIARYFDMDCSYYLDE